ARFSGACRDADAAAAVEALRADLPRETGYYDAGDVGWLFEDAAAAAGDRVAERPHFLFLYAVDAAPGDGELLRRILRHGPERRIHVLGWWRGAAMLREEPGGPGWRHAPLRA